MITAHNIQIEESILLYSESYSFWRQRNAILQLSVLVNVGELTTVIVVGSDFSIDFIYASLDRCHICTVSKIHQLSIPRRYGLPIHIGTIPTNPKQCETMRDNAKPLACGRHVGVSPADHAIVCKSGRIRSGIINIFGPVSFEACLNCTIACRHGSNWLIVYIGNSQGAHKCIMSLES